MVEYSKTKAFQEDIKNFPPEEYFNISNNNMKNIKNSTSSTSSPTGVIEEEEDSFSDIQDLLK